MKPATIRRFEMFYLAWVVLTVVDFFLRRDAYVAQAVAASSANGGGTSGIVLGSTFITVVFAVWVLVMLLFWYLVSNKHSVVAKWIIVVLTVIGFIGLPKIFQHPLDTGAIIGLLMLVASAGASISLFGAQARAWFGGETPAEPAAEE